MTIKNIKIKPKRLAKSKRKYIRRMKQAARKASTTILTVHGHNHP